MDWSDSFTLPRIIADSSNSLTSSPEKTLINPDSSETAITSSAVSTETR